MDGDIGRSTAARRRTPGLPLLITLIVMGAAVWLAYPHVPSRETAAWPEDPPALVIGGQLSPAASPLIGDTGEILLPLEAVHLHVDEYVFWEPGAGVITITTADKVLRMATDQLTAHMNQRPVDLVFPVQVVDEVPHIPLAPLAELYGLRYEYHDATSTLVLDMGGTVLQGARATGETVARTGPGVKNPAIRTLAENEKVYVLEEEDGWYRIRTSDGVLAHVPKSRIELAGIETIPRGDRPGVSFPRPMGERIIMTWDYVGGTGDRAPRFMDYPPMPGVNVISPTWFHLADDRGTITSLADPAYVRWAHESGMQVWALVTNGFLPDRTRPVLRDPDLREKVIVQLLSYAAVYGLDGINVDFENMYMADRDYFSQFIRELTPLAREQGLVVSVDVTAISLSENWSLCYDRVALGRAADYVILMAYDQHPAASPVAGPVASLDWTERSLVRVLDQVPRDKLILGIPFYTRVWTEEPQAGAGVRVSSRALGMRAAQRLIAENNAQMMFDEAAGALHAWYTEGPVTHRLWLEDQVSIRSRAALANRYGLPGVAAWRRGFEVPAIWTVLSEMLSGIPTTDR